MKQLINFNTILTYYIFVIVMTVGLFLYIRLAKRDSGAGFITNVTRWILLISTIIYLFALAGIYLPSFSPVTFSINLPFFNQVIIEQVILILVFGLLYGLSYLSRPKPVIQLVWWLFLLANVLNVITQTYYFITYEKPPSTLAGGSGLSNLLDSFYPPEIRFTDYLRQLLKPILWIIAALFSLKKLSADKES